MLNFSKWSKTTWFVIGLIQLILFGILVLVLSLINTAKAPTQVSTSTPTLQPTTTPYPYQGHNFSEEARDICGRTYPWFKGSGKVDPSSDYKWDPNSNTGIKTFSFYPNGLLAIDEVVYQYNYNIDSITIERIDGINITPAQSAAALRKLKELTIFPVQITFNIKDYGGSYGYLVPECLPIPQ